MGRARPNEAKIVDGILGHIYPLDILTPLHEKLHGRALNVHVAFHRIVLGLELVAQWDDYISGKDVDYPPNTAAALRGGASSAQNSRETNNPSGTDQGHYVQAAVDNVKFSTLPPKLQRLFGHTLYVPRAHNRGIHRSIDNAQESLINEYLKYKKNNAHINVPGYVPFNTSWFDANLAITYCNEVLQRINTDDTEKNFQYKDCAKDDVDDYYFTVQTMRDSFKRRVENDQRNDVKFHGREFVTNPQNFQLLKPSPEDY